MHSSEYRTKTLFLTKDNIKPSETVWPVGLDVGYSSVKVFSGNAAVCFPSFAEINEADIHINVGLSDNRMILYKGEDGIIWTVGAVAQDMIDEGNAASNSMSVFDRNRYQSPMFKILARVGIAAGCRKNMYGDPAGKKILIQTGLPPKYMAGDSQALLKALSGHHKYSVRFGEGNWENFDFTLDTGKENLADNDVLIMDQPMGSVLSIMMDKNAHLTKNAVNYARAKLLVVDPGFGTLDIFPVIRNSVQRKNCDTNENLGMKRVLSDTSEELLKQYHTEIPVQTMQQYLENGYVIKRDGFKTSKEPFSDILEKNSRAVCKEMMDYIAPWLEKTEYLIITGGTGEAWFDYILEDERIKDAGALTVVEGNAGDTDFPFLFSNARGFYMRAAAKAKTEK